MSICEFLYRLVVPRLCACCGEPLLPKREGDVCEKCEPELDKFRLCGELRLSYKKNEKLSSSLDGVVASYRYAGIARITLLRYKYILARDPQTKQRFLARVMARDFEDFDFSRETDLITSVPATDASSCHAELLAVTVSELSGIRYDGELILKAVRTRRQHNLLGHERRKNLRGVFVASNAAKGRQILVVDDVTTTGATLNECARALKSAGARKVYGLVFAST